MGCGVAGAALGPRAASGSLASRLGGTSRADGWWCACRVVVSRVVAVGVGVVVESMEPRAASGSPAYRLGGKHMEGGVVGAALEPRAASGSLASRLGGTSRAGEWCTLVTAVVASAALTLVSGRP
jgi:hypothetical protein